MIMSTTTKVWFQLFLRHTALNPSSVTLNEDSLIADLKDAVKKKCENSLSSIDAAQLLVYPPGTQVPVADVPALNPGDRVVESATFVVVAPDFDQRMTKRQKQGGDQIKDSLSVLLKEKLNDYFDHLKKEQKERSIEQKMHIYKIEPNELNSDPTISAFSPVDGYWMKDVQQERFDDGESRGILYRPKIVKEMMKVVDDTFNKNRRGGIMIKGPHGIGKSHSLVNLVRTLQYDSSCKYLVTFIPDCDRWECVGNLYTAICNSFGTTLTALKWQIGSGLDEQLVSLNNFVKAIDLILRRMDRRWVLVFDQVNRLFYRPVLDKADDLGTLPFPFSAINNIMKRGRRIVSIISASTDNEVAYKARHRGFEQYNHPCNMDLKEICAAFEEVETRSDKENIFEVTGGVPLQVRKLISYKFSFEDYQEAELHSILCSLENLPDKKTKCTWDDITASAVGCVLSNTGDVIQHDMEFSVPAEGKETNHYKPLFPLVLEGYRIFFWKEIMAFVHKHEQVLLDICANPDLTNDARGQIFEFIVINRCSINANVTFERLLPLKNCNFIETFPSKQLPKIMDKDGMYVPENSNFPAIDLIWKFGKFVCGVQVHISKPDNVLEKFTAMCNEAGWLTKFSKVYLLYLSPEQKLADSAQCNIPETQGPITVVALCKSSIPCLNSLQWPFVSSK